MTNKPNSGTVSVSRERLERIAKTCMFTLSSADYEYLRATLAEQHIVCSNGILCQSTECAECGGNGSYKSVTQVTQPADQQGEPVALPTDWRSLADQLQEVGLAYWKAHDRERDRGAVKFLHNEETGALFVVTRGEYADQLKDFIFSLDCPAQPATAKVVLPECLPELNANEPPCTACFARGCNGECMENL